MSVMIQDPVACPKCGKEASFDVCLSVNGGRHAHFRTAILDGSFQRQTCADCGTTFRATPEFSYFDASRAQWILVRPAGQAELWEDLETVALDIFAAAFGAGAPAGARELGRRLSPRVVFGWPALREKVLAASVGVSDVDLELVKLSVLRSSDEWPLADDVELRLLSADEDTLTLGWVRPVDGAVKESVDVDRALLAEVAAPSWTPLRAQLDAGPFVDVDRLLVEPVSG